MPRTADLRLVASGQCAGGGHDAAGGLRRALASSSWLSARTKAAVRRYAAVRSWIQLLPGAPSRRTVVDATGHFPRSFAAVRETQAFSTLG